MQLDFDLSKPIYQQIIDEIQRQIARGELKPGDRIMSQRELARKARVNPNTVQRAYREMEQMGLTETKRGQGSFICGDTALIHSIKSKLAQQAVEHYIQEMYALGWADKQIVRLVEEQLDAKRDQSSRT